jgi:hypothetical protein
LRDYPCVQRLHGLLPGAHCLHVASLPTTPKPKLAYLQLFISCISIRLAVLFYLSISPFIDYFLRTPHPYSGFLLLRIPFNCIRTDFHHILHLRHIYPTWTFNISYFQLHIQHYSCFLFLTNSAPHPLTGVWAPDPRRVTVTRSDRIQRPPSSGGGRRRFIQIPRNHWNCSARGSGQEPKVCR